jgi:indolepyruvate ferredoxin oxidoreductase
MTGGQPVDGPVSVQAIAHSVRSPRVCRGSRWCRMIPSHFSSADLPAGVTIHPREDMDAVQRELRQMSGVTVLIYQQTCATEKRRRRKRRHGRRSGKVCVPSTTSSARAAAIARWNPIASASSPRRRRSAASARSTCRPATRISPASTASCPSFAHRRGRETTGQGASAIDPLARAAALPAPEFTTLDTPYDLLITGVGGTGVITVGALIAMAAHLEGRGVSVLDFTGFAQKFGPVLSFLLRLAATPDALQPGADRPGARRMP